MAAHLGVHSLGLARRLTKIVRPVSSALLGLSCPSPLPDILRLSPKQSASTCNLSHASGIGPGVSPAGSRKCAASIKFSQLRTLGSSYAAGLLLNDRGDGGAEPCRSMQARGCSRAELWDFYKEWVKESGFGLNQAQAYVALLQSGIWVRELQSLKHVDDFAFRRRLTEALFGMGRIDEAQAFLREALKSEEPMSFHNLILSLTSLIRVGAIAEAQELADAQERLGTRLDGALMLHIRRRGRFEAKKLCADYEALEAINGPHRTSMGVLTLLITDVYRKLSGRTEDMYQAYLKEKGLRDIFDPKVHAVVIQRLSNDDRITEAEGVLADYYNARMWRQPPEPLDPFAFHSLGNAYWRARQPGKLVDVVKHLLSQNQLVDDVVIQDWTRSFRLHNHLA